MDGKGRSLDNIFIERLCRSLKQEAVYLYETTDGFQAKRIINDWIGFYNSERPNTALDKRTPDISYFTKAKIRKAAWKEIWYILANPQTCPKKENCFKLHILFNLGHCVEQNCRKLCDFNTLTKVITGVKIKGGIEAIKLSEIAIWTKKPKDQIWQWPNVKKSYESTTFSIICKHLQCIQKHIRRFG